MKSAATRHIRSRNQQHIAYNPYFPNPNRRAMWSKPNRKEMRNISIKINKEFTSNSPATTLFLRYLLVIRLQPPETSSNSPSSSSCPTSFSLCPCSRVFLSKSLLALPPSPVSSPGFLTYPPPSV